MPPAELADRAEVGRIARHDHHEVRPLHRRPGDPPRRVEAARIAVQKQRRHHPRVKRRLPQPAPVAAAHRGKVKLLSNQRHDQPRQMLLGHVVLHARRQKLRFIDLPGTKVLAHGYATNQTRPNLTSDFSDRLLGAIETEQRTHLRWTLTIALALAGLIATSGAFLMTRVDRVEDRLSKLETSVNELPGKLSGSLAQINQTLFQAITASKQTSPQVILLPAPSPTDQ